MYKISVIPGDGIGKEVMEATLHVLEAIDLEFDYTFADAGDEYMEKGVLKDLNNSKEFKIKPLPEFMRGIMKEGGLISYLKNHLAEIKDE